jgi:hypothetical protein
VTFAHYARAGALTFACMIVATTASRPLGAQSGPLLSAGLDAGTVRLAREGPARVVFSGSLLGVHGGIAFRRFGLDAHYAEGTLSAAVGSLSDDEQLADAEVLLRYQLKPWLSVGAGPHLRAFITPTGTAHWTRVDARARVEGEVIPGLARAHFGVWYALSVDASAQGGGTGAQGGEAGLTVRLPRTPFGIQLSYAADRASYVTGSAEFLERVGLSFVMGHF